MSYVALYRTYRPKFFHEVFGQRIIVKTLQNALQYEKFAHAYIFSGPRGTGKTSIAKIVAKALNCEKAPTNEPCGECKVCKGIEKGDISDVIEIDAASNNGVEEIRDLRDKVKYAPSVGKYKVYIIDEVHMLTTAAFNALLKTLEEPPKNVVFILATTEIHKLPATILSRCQRFDFKNIDQNDIEENLKKITQKENLTITPEAISAIALTSEGGMRDALSLLDQVISFTNTNITEEDVYKVSGGLSRRFINDLLLTIYEKKPQKALDLINQVLSDGKDVLRMVSDIVIALRDCLMDKINKEKKYEDLFIIPTRMIYAYLDILNDLQVSLKYTTSKRAYLELAIIKMMNHQSIEIIDLENQIYELTNKIDKIEKNIDKQSKNNTKVNVIQNNEAPNNLKPLVTVKEVEDILNNGDKEKKNLLKKGWPALSNYDVPNLKGVAKLLSDGQLEAVGNNIMLLVYDDIYTAKTMLKEDTKQKVLQILNNKHHLVDGYIAVIKPDWILLKDNYIEELNSGASKPSLKNIDLHLYEDNLRNDSTIENIDPLLDFAIKSFGQDKVKVEE